MCKQIDIVPVLNHSTSCSRKMRSIPPCTLVKSCQSNFGHSDRAVQRQCPEKKGIFVMRFCCHRPVGECELFFRFFHIQLVSFWGNESDIFWFFFLFLCLNLGGLLAPFPSCVQDKQIEASETQTVSTMVRARDGLLQLAPRRRPVHRPKEEPVRAPKDGTVMVGGLGGRSLESPGTYRRRRRTVMWNHKTWWHGDGHDLVDNKTESHGWKEKNVWERKWKKLEWKLWVHLGGRFWFVCWCFLYAPDPIFSLLLNE